VKKYGNLYVKKVVPDHRLHLKFQGQALVMTRQTTVYHRSVPRIVAVSTSILEQSFMEVHEIRMENLNQKLSFKSHENGGNKGLPSPVSQTIAPSH